MILYLAEVTEAFGLTLVEHNFFEAGEGKTLLDTHFAHISHKIIRWVRVGNDLESGEQLADLLQVIQMLLKVTWWKVLMATLVVGHDSNFNTISLLLSMIYK